jgi:hypothetical protein
VSRVMFRMANTLARKVLSLMIGSDSRGSLNTKNCIFS